MSESDCRISKRLAQDSYCSRREADEWIARGWVIVDGKPAILGQKINSQQKIVIKKDAYDQQARAITVLLNKPVGYVSGQPENNQQPAIKLITTENRWQQISQPASNFSERFSDLGGLAPAGRLDFDSTGLLVMTQDGRIAKQLIGQSSLIEKEYLVRVRDGGVLRDVASHVSAERIARLRSGLSLDGVRLKNAEVDWQNGEQLRFILHEGRKRQIRRMCELVGLTVIGLKRVRIGKILLGGLPTGKWRVLQAGENF